MSDLISRQDAIEFIRKNVSKAETEDSLWFNLGLGVAEKVVESLPSAEPPYQYSEAYVNQLRGERDILQDIVDNMAEPKTGGWVQKDMYADRFCSECNYAVWDSEAEEYNFCPNCGVRMTPYKGGDDK